MEGLFIQIAGVLKVFPCNIPEADQETLVRQRRGSSGIPA